MLGEQSQWAGGRDDADGARATHKWPMVRGELMGETARTGPARHRSVSQRLNVVTAGRAANVAPPRGEMGLRGDPASIIRGSSDVSSAQA